MGGRIRAMVQYCCVDCVHAVVSYVPDTLMENTVERKECKNPRTSSILEKNKHGYCRTGRDISSAYME